jgi:hypothetical protein
MTALDEIDIHNSLAVMYAIKMYEVYKRGDNE